MNRKQIMIIIAFLILNFLACLLHIEAFQSNLPYLVFLTLIVHILTLVFLPYRKFIK